MKHILVVDDVTTNLICAKEILKDTYEVTTAKSAKAALEIIKESKPDLVLTDICMPEMDGFLFYETMKENRDSADIPVVFCTAENDREVVEKGSRLGIDCIRKPYSPEYLCEVVNRAFRKQELLAEQMSDGYFYEQKPQLKNKESLQMKVDDERTKGYFVLMNVENYGRLFHIFGEDMTDEVFLKMEKVLDEELGRTHMLSYVTDEMFAFYIDGGFLEKHMRTLVRRVIAGIEFEINEEIHGEFDIRLVLSAGIAAKPADGKTYEKLRECADKALYYLKQSGKRGYHFYNSQPETEDEYAEMQSIINVEQAERLIKRRMQTVTEITLDKAYQILVRCLSDKRNCGQMLLFSFEGAEESSREQVMEVFGEVINSSLRKGDAAFVCGRSSRLVVLNSTSTQNGEMVADRIKEKFDREIKNEAIILNCQMKTI